jgi:hypothetical protein
MFVLAGASTPAVAGIALPIFASVPFPHPPGWLVFGSCHDTYFNDDESEALVIERFRDSQALIEHGEHVAAIMEPIIATASVSGELLCELSPELRAKMIGDVPQLFRLYRSM